MFKKNVTLGFDCTKEGNNYYVRNMFFIFGVVANMKSTFRRDNFSTYLRTDPHQAMKNNT